MQTTDKKSTPKQKYKTPTLHKIGNLKTITLKTGSVADGLTGRDI